MKILKFGGSSIGSSEKIAQVLNIIGNRAMEAESFVIVLSAYESVTDQLIRMGKLAAEGNDQYHRMFMELEQRHISVIKDLISIKGQSTALTYIKILLNELEDILQGVFLVKELTAKTLDYIMSFGERFAAFTFSECLKDRKVDNRYVDSRDIIITDNSYGRAMVDFPLSNKKIKSCFDKSVNVYIVTGFIASTKNKETTTIGRGGSDYTASIIGAALNVSEIEIWTDVDGVLTADPSKVSNAFSLDHLTYEEAMELSHFGAKVVYPPTMQPALNKKIPIRVRNTFNPGFQGTVISYKTSSSKYFIKGISSIDEVALIQIQGSGMVGVAGIAERIFNALAREKINIILISQASSEHSICIAIPPEYKDLAKKALEMELDYELRIEMVSEISIENDLAIIAVVGENMRKTRGIAGRVFQSLGNNGINISAIAQGSSELNISMVISKSDETKALNALHNSFFLSGTKILNLYLVGTGLIGKTLLSQLQKNEEYLRDKRKISIRLIGLANIEKMIYESKGIELSGWEQKLETSKHQTDIDKYIEAMKAINLPNSVFVDCTADDYLAEKYLDILKLNISIATPNKKANTKSYTYYSQLRNHAFENSVKFLYETNVGAALPILNTIRELVSSGDRITKIEGILSGTLSYIFNSFKPGKTFSEIILQAKEQGFTEPDPREDLNGMDVARKLLILIREAGYQKEMDDITIENLIPEELRGISSQDEFLLRLKDCDDLFEAKRVQAEKHGQALRYIASFESPNAEVLLRAVDENHPFYHLQGNDNIIAIYSLNYKTNPLVIRGPGAGAEVTAAGVLADILRVTGNFN